MLTLFQSSPRQLAQRALFKAQRDVVSHSCQAEYHNAMAMMLRERAQRLQEVIESDSVDARITPAQFLETRS